MSFSKGSNSVSYGIRIVCVTATFLLPQSNKPKMLLLFPVYPIIFPYSHTFTSSIRTSQNRPGNFEMSYNAFNEFVFVPSMVSKWRPFSSNFIFWGIRKNCNEPSLESKEAGGTTVI